MAKDVARRELDQGGFRISNLGDPQSPRRCNQDGQHDRSAGECHDGIGWQSVFAAPADHVHPIASNHYPYVLGFSGFDGAVAGRGPAETPGCTSFPSHSPRCHWAVWSATLAAAVEVDSGTATFNLRLGPTPDVVDGVLLTTITTVSATFEAQAFSSDAFSRPDVETFLKVTAANDNAAATCRIKNKTVVLHSV